MPDDVDERTPLLEEEIESAGHVVDPPSVPLNNLTAVLAALRRDKLPTKSQANTILDTLLSSALLDEQYFNTLWRPAYGKGRLGTGRLTRQGEQVRKAVRELLVATKDMVNKYDDEDTWQSFWYEWKASSEMVHLHPPHLPKTTPEGKSEVKKSIHSLVFTVVSSPSLRQLISELVLVSKVLLEPKIEEQLGPDSRAQEVLDEIAQEVADRVRPDPEELSDSGETTDSGQDITDRLLKILHELQANPEYLDALKNIFGHVKSYAASLSDTATPSISLSPSPVPVLEPFTGPLAPVFDTFHTLLTHFTNPTEHLAKLMSRTEIYVEKVLLTPGFLESPKSRQYLNKLQEAWRQFLSSENPNPADQPFRVDLLAFLSAVLTAFNNLAHDTALRDLLASLGHLAVAMEQWVVAVAHLKDNVWGDVVEWLLPTILRMLGELPLPRIEFESNEMGLRGAVDAPVFLGASLIPDSVKLDTNVHSVLSFPTEASSEPTTSDSTLFIKGVRFASLEIGYFVKWKNCCCGIEEKGLLDFAVGGVKEEQGGMDVQVEMSTTTQPDEDEEGSLWKVGKAKAHISNFDLKPNSSSHPIIFWFLTPIMRRLVRGQLEKLIQTKVQEALRWAGRTGWEVSEKASEMDGKFKWAIALAQVLLDKSSGDEEEEEEESTKKEDKSLKDGGGDAGPSIHVTSRGLKVDLDAGEVGVGEEGVVIPPPEAETAAHRSHISDIVDDETRHDAETVVEAAETVGEAAETYQDVTAAEKRKKGWKSKAFDW
ncbi:hypothetical protein MNV49_000098 [Pseudohyphozyma bogoriensis]|nr:hypothetical protein MNV49_000098 [Pseudohyphozyma bogoriensis]